MKRIGSLQSVTLFFVIVFQTSILALVGDVDGSGDIDGYDAVLILRHDVGLSTLTGTDLTNADTDRSGDVDGYDAVLILRCDVGLIECDFGPANITRVTKETVVVIPPEANILESDLNVISLSGSTTANDYSEIQVEIAESNLNFMPVKDSSDNLIMIGSSIPEAMTAKMGSAGRSLQRIARSTTTGGVKISPESTALSLILLSQYSMGANQEFRLQMAATAVSLPEFQELVDSIYNLIASGDKSVLDPIDHPEIIYAASQVADAAYNIMRSTLSRTAAAQSCPVMETNDLECSAVEYSDPLNIVCNNPKLLWYVAEVKGIGHDYYGIKYIAEKSQWHSIVSGLYCPQRTDIFLPRDGGYEIYACRGASPNDIFGSTDDVCARAARINLGYYMLRLLDVIVPCFGTINPYARPDELADMVNSYNSDELFVIYSGIGAHDFGEFYRDRETWWRFLEELVLDATVNSISAIVPELGTIVMAFYKLSPVAYDHVTAKPMLKYYINSPESTCYIECRNNMDCDDGKTTTIIDKCINPIGCDSFCQNAECLSDSDCDDKDPYTSDSCIDNGDVNYVCRHERIKCYFDSDCYDSERKISGKCLNASRTYSSCQFIGCSSDADCPSSGLSTGKCRYPGMEYSRCEYSTQKDCPGGVWDSTKMQCSCFTQGEIWTGTQCEAAPVYPVNLSIDKTTTDSVKLKWPCGTSASQYVKRYEARGSISPGVTMSSILQETKNQESDRDTCYKKFSGLQQGTEYYLKVFSCTNYNDLSTCTSPSNEVSVTTLCQEGFHSNGYDCVTCTGGQVWNALTTSCICPNGTAWSGTACVNEYACNSHLDCSESMPYCINPGTLSAICVECLSDSNCSGGGTCINSECIIPIANEWITIPEGPFVMGCADADTQCHDFEKPKHSVMLSEYRIQKYEVTNAQYKTCVDASVCTALSGNETYDNFPVTNVNWYNATAYCEWIGGRLPTEAEWEKAARGPSPREVIYPWGNETPAYNVVVGGYVNVGSYSSGASYYEVMDMAGNVMEWVNDWFSPDYYSSSPNINPQGPSSGYLNYRVMKGGSWAWSSAYYLRVSFRHSIGPSNGWDSGLGFRCAQN